ncbi:MAG: hypothetical protein LBU37_15420 [Tannerellaceae bacterium]|jgi:hypothetical protein|nr:hypothetical protein [Tannerellaceae bacterium]
MNTKIYYSIALCIILSGCTQQKETPKETPQEVTVTNDVLTVQITRPDYTDETMYSFLRCADIVLSQVKKNPNDYLFNLLDEEYFRSQEPVFLIQKTKYTKVRYNPYSPYWGYRYNRSRYFTFGTKSSVQYYDEVYTRVNYNDVLTNYFRGDLFGDGHSQAFNNREATKYIYKIFVHLFGKEVRKYNIFNEIYTQHAKGNIVFIPLNELYDKYENYKEHKPNVDILKFENYTKSQSIKSKQPITDYYLYLKYSEL